MLNRIGIEWFDNPPKNWMPLKIKYCFKTEKSIVGNDFPNYQLLSLTKDGVKEINEDEQTGKKPASFATYQKVEKNDIIMCLFDLDVSAVFSGVSHSNGMISPAYRIYKCSNLLYPNYVNYYFREAFNGRKFKRYSNNIRYSINSDTFKDLYFLVPPLSEQEAIANFLDTKCSKIDKVITTEKKLVERLKEYKQSIITKAVTTGLDPNLETRDSGIDWVGKIPKHWRLIKIKYSSKLERGIFSHRPRNDIRFYNGPYPFIQTGDVATSNKYIRSFSQTLNDLGKSVSKCFKKGTLVFTLAANIADIAILGFDAYFPDSVMGIQPNANFYPDYLYYVMSAAKNEFLKSSVVNTQSNLNVERVGNIKIPITYHIEEQEAIANYLDEKCLKIDEAISKSNSLINKLEEYKKSLIYEYVTGKKEVPMMDER